MKKIITIIGARPQFIKHAPMQIELQKYFNSVTIHTGQHYDENMSEIFFNQLNIPHPDYLLSVQSSFHGEQTGLMMIEIEKILLKEMPHAVLIYGDTNSTLAGTIVATKLSIPIIHIEAGLRSYNRSMPEEINRIIADEFSQLLFCPSDTAVQNLKKEGISHSGIYKTGDVMKDMIELVRDKVVKPIIDSYYFVTIHRPYNTDNLDRIKEILSTLNGLEKKIIFAIHPRTRQKLNANKVELTEYNNILFIDPVGYIESIAYQMYSDVVITDSGGIQKEAYILKKKCITLRSETEWKETLHNGWNALVFEDLDQIPEVLKKVPGDYIEGVYGDGNATKEIVEIIRKNI